MRIPCGVCLCASKAAQNGTEDHAHGGIFFLSVYVDVDVDVYCESYIVICSCNRCYVGEVLWQHINNSYI